MNSDVVDLLKDAEHRMKSALVALEEHLGGLRTGRASPALVDKLMIDYYGTPTPLMQLASIQVPEALMILIKPYDKTSLKTIEKAIQTSELGLNPNNDGTVIRLNLPPLTQERRKELVKMMHGRLEEARVAIRNVRRSANDDIRDYQKESMISEDESHKGQEDLQKLTDKYIAEVEAVGKRKEQEIMAV
ncbi:MAG TPA: ribosome recycling factor [Aggregatilineales bacterium]|nr:ribosome recycling factor [Anaerolineales bacterium]HRE48113.1 ribosome recycling factor [Aggregatilineales bacterium]